MKFLCVCQVGLGSSFMVQMNIQNVLNSEGVTEDIEIGHADVGSTTPDMADYFFMEKTLGEMNATLPRDKMVLLNSLIDQNETREKVNAILDKEGIAHN